MAESKSDEQFRVLQREIRASIRRNHPNPDRIGCVGTEKLSRIARRELAADDPAYGHVMQCSPCYEELMTLTEQAEARAVAGAYRRRAVLLAVAAAIIVVIAASFLLLRGRPGIRLDPRQPVPIAKNTGPATDLPGAVLNLESGTRGVEPGGTSRGLQRLPRKKVSLRVYLPVGLEEGHYEVTLDRGSGPPLLELAGDARMEDGLAVLRIQPDLAGLAPGQYRLRYRRGDESWREATILLE
jgi:hypothetical protein